MQALILEQQDGKTLASVQYLEENQLPEGDVTGGCPLVQSEL
ncbi:oxidoreductase [Salmonella enterica subsp. arizonae]|nr:oxidoreductase [Salmonella enterica subsp. arizonae]